MVPVMILAGWYRILGDVGDFEQDVDVFFGQGSYDSGQDFLRLLWFWAVFL